MASHNMVAVERDRCGECEHFDEDADATAKGWAIAIDGLIDAMPDLCPECRVAALAWMRCQPKLEPVTAAAATEETS